MDLKRISITGPESTGKSVLAKELAEYYGTVWVPEYSREYLKKLDREYDFDDIARIARGQMKNEETLSARAEKIIFCDTDLLVCKVWSEFRYGRCDPWLEQQVGIHIYDLYLLCNIDIPWTYDPLRENRDQRQELFEIYRRELEKMNVNFAIVSGMGRQRLLDAISAIGKRLFM